MTPDLCWIQFSSHRLALLTEVIHNFPYSLHLVVGHGHCIHTTEKVSEAKTYFFAYSIVNCCWYVNKFMPVMFLLLIYSDNFKCFYALRDEQTPTVNLESWHT
jgi:hypothetical protein